MLGVMGAAFPILPDSPRSARPQDRLGSSLHTLVRAMAAVVVLLCAWRFAPVGDPAAKARFIAGAMLPLTGATLVLFWLAPWHPGVDSRVRRAWMFLAAAVTAWWLDSAVWALLGNPALSIADLGQLAYIPLLLVGVFAFPSVPLARGPRRQFWLDASVVVLSAAAAVWYFDLWPLLARGGTVPELVVNALYPFGDLVLVFAACVALWRGGAEHRGTTVWVAAGLTSQFLGDLVHGWEALRGERAAGGIGELLWIGAVVLLAVGAVARRRAAVGVPAEAAPESSAQPGDAAPRGVSLLPYCGALMLFTFLAVAAGGARNPDTLGVLAVALVVTALVLARQVYAARENVQLHREQARLEAERAGEARFRALVQHSSDLIIVVDVGGTVRYASPAIERMTGFTPEAATGRPLLWFVHPEEVAPAEEALANTVLGSDAFGPLRFRVRAPNGWRAVEVLASNQCRDPVVNGVILTVRDVTERARLEAQLVHQAFHDPLTGLANRTLFRERVERALSREGRQVEDVVALFLDLDDFKTVNDSLGHREGDRLLAVVAERLLNATRGCDTVARLGGDEFAVLLENARSEEDAVVVAERVVQSLRVPIALAGQEVSVGASVGIARARPEDGAEELLRNADVAMYKAKQRGKNTYEIFAPAMHAALVDRMELEADLRRLVADDCAELRVHYQPIVSLADGGVTGVEALARWTHPRRGPVPPAVFIPAAEATGLIVPLGRWVLREACAQAARWSARRDEGAPLAVSVNLSARQLQHQTLVDDVRDALHESGFPANLLLLELTESVFLHDTDVTLETLRALKALGVRLAIDDFGTGYASLGYLQQFPLDVLKIDRRFVDGMCRGGSEAALARTIIALGDSLALRTVAEGVARPQQQEQLKALGCEYGQGFLFAHPVPPEEITRLLEDRDAAAA